MHPTVDVEVIGIKGRMKLKATVDTGFTGYICVPSKIAHELGLVLIGEEDYELANGQWVTHSISKARFIFSARRKMRRYLSRKAKRLKSAYCCWPIAA